MIGLLVLGLPFALVSARWPRPWAIALPLLLWGGLALLESLGILHVFSGDAAPVLIIGGTLFAIAGFALARLRDGPA